MNEQYKPLFEAIRFRNGMTLDSRFVMAPMVAEGSTYEGYVGKDDLNYFKRRSQAASLLITGSASVASYGNAFGYGLEILNDSYIPGLKELANTMKADGAKAILQIFHPGYQAKYTYRDEGIVYGPISQQFPFFNYPMTALSDEQIQEMILAFGEATRRAIQAGFDGVEIHGANHYLIQQFFSPVTNQRDDNWGGTLAKRGAFPLAVVKAVTEAVNKLTTEPFIVGYRISPEEIHGESVNYSLDDSLYLMEEIISLEIDYLHISQFGEAGYKTRANAGKHTGEIINQVIHDRIAGRTKHIIAGGIMSADLALDALNYADLVGLASAVIVDPDFKAKIAAGQEDEITFALPEDLSSLHLPRHFPLMIHSLKRNGLVPEPTIEAIEQLKQQTKP